MSLKEPLVGFRPKAELHPPPVGSLETNNALCEFERHAACVMLMISLIKSRETRDLFCEMIYGVRPVKPYLPDRLSGYFDGIVHRPRAMHDLKTWVPTLNSLRVQKGYLEDLLSKTATTLNALRDRQTRNQRVLSTRPTPRSKRKKMEQNRWRTSKTIQTCENEEKVILDCLQVCLNNIHTLEAIIYHPPELMWTSAERYGSTFYGNSDTTPFDWQGWTDDVLMSPFEQTRRGPLPMEEPMDEIAPEHPAASYVEAETRCPASLHLPYFPGPTSTFLVAPPNCANFALSPEAASFEPSTTHAQLTVTQLAKELDKLTIAGLLASKRMSSIRRRRSSDEAVAVRCLSSTVQPRSTRAGSCPIPLHEMVDGGSAGKRCISI
jgi:hypothetical protein